MVNSFIEVSYELVENNVPYEPLPTFNILSTASGVANWTLNPLLLDLIVDESILTGESIGVNKNSDKNNIKDIKII